MYCNRRTKLRKLLVMRSEGEGHIAGTQKDKVYDSGCHVGRSLFLFWDVQARPSIVISHPESQPVHAAWSTLRHAVTLPFSKTINHTSQRHVSTTRLAFAEHEHAAVCKMSCAALKLLPYFADHASSALEHTRLRPLEGT